MRALSGQKRAHEAPVLASKLMEATRIHAAGRDEGAAEGSESARGSGGVGLDAVVGSGWELEKGLELVAALGWAPGLGSGVEERA